MRATMRLFWLRSYGQTRRKIASLRLAGMPVPPEMPRLIRHAFRGFAYASDATECIEFSDACDLAAEMAPDMPGHRIAVSLVSQVNDRADVRMGYFVHREDRTPPNIPGQFKVQTLVTYSNQP